MNRFINYLDRKIGKYAIPNLPLYMVICYGIGYLMELINPDICLVLSLNPYAILHGQVWRLVSWLLIPPSSLDFWTLIMLYFYYSIGTTLERTWGKFYFNYYIFSGVIFTIIGAFCLYGYDVLFQPEQVIGWNEGYRLVNGEFPWIYGMEYGYALESMSFSTFYVSMSIFLGFAATYPDMQILLMFILPIKVKVLGVIYVILLAVGACSMGLPTGIFVVGASLLNFILFFIATRKGTHMSMAQRKRQAEYKRKVKSAPSPKIAKHKCAICGRTSEEYPDLEFRFCSKCEGNYEYCQEHLFTHQHKSRM